MRKVLAIVLAALVAGGCNAPRPTEQSRSIGFATALTRSLVSSAEELQQLQIKLFGTYTLSERTVRIFDEQTLYYNDELPGWDYASTQYWISGAYYNFFAVAPFETSCYLSEGKNQVILSEYSSWTDGPDVLYASAKRDLAVVEDFSAVPLTFHHACAAVQFNIVNASNNVLTDVRNVRLVGLCNKGTFRFSPDGVAEWALDGSTVAATAAEQPFAGSCILPNGGLPVNLTVEHPLYENSVVVVLPQSIYKSGVTLHMEYKKVGDSEYAVRDIGLGLLGGTTPTEWKAGELYKYNLNITDNTITTEVKVVDWVDNFVDL